MEIGIGFLRIWPTTGYLCSSEQPYTNAHTGLILNGLSGFLNEYIKLGGKIGSSIGRELEGRN